MNAHMRGLEVCNVSVEYDGVPVLSHVHVQVATGEIIALLGPSGCGKSTLLRAVSGLEPLTTGHILWNGADLLKTPPHERGFGLLFQDGQLFTHMSVAQNIGYGLRVQRMEKGDRGRRVEEMLDLVDLSGFGGRSVTELSGGQRQRVALARSLAPSPKLLMLDEPLSALDNDLRGQLAGDLARLLRETHTTAILVTHDESEAQTIADRVHRMQAGRILA